MKKESIARKLCRHTVVYTDILDAMIVVRALQGRTTKSITREFGITESRVQYRISKAQRGIGKARFRRDFRNGAGPLSKAVRDATQHQALGYVNDHIVPKWVEYAKAGVSRKPLQ